jgi:hypothetical protein
MDDRLRTIGAVVAAAISAVVAVAALAIGHLELVVVGAALGVPVGAVLGFRNAPRIAGQTAGHAFASAFALAATAVVLGDLFVSIAWLLMALVAALGGSTSTLGPLAFFVWMVALPVLGLVFLGLPAFALAFCVLWPWTFVVRWLGGDRRADAVGDDRLVAERLG